MLISTNSLLKNDDNAGAVTVTVKILSLFDKFVNKSPKWRGKTANKIKKLGKMIASSCYFEESFWDTFRQLKTIIIDDYIRTPTETLLQHLQIEESKRIVEQLEPSEPIKKIDDPSTCTFFYALLHLKSTEYKLDPPIILYGRLFEEDHFQYVAFIFRQRVFIIEISTTFLNVQERACETMCTLIRESGGLPNNSLLIKIENSMARVVAEIDIQNNTIILCDSLPVDLMLLNSNEIIDLIAATNYLMNFGLTWISKLYADTLYFKRDFNQPFVEGLHINGHVFGCMKPCEKENDSETNHQIVLALCDRITQSNFLWNNKPLAVNLKIIFGENYLFSNVPYQEIVLQPMKENLLKSGGIRFGDEIEYQGPLDIILD